MEFSVHSQAHVIRIFNKKVPWLDFYHRRVSIWKMGRNNLVASLHERGGGKEEERMVVPNL